jgi:hypothetical protein
MKRALFITLGGPLIIAGLYGPFYIGCEILPDGWTEHPTTYWWTVPMLLTLVACKIVGIGFGAACIAVATRNPKKDDWDL